MKTQRALFGLIVGTMLMLLSGCNPFGPSSYRYKMTITVKTSGGVQSFSSVRAVSYSSRLEGGYNANLNGEAIVMDLPGRTVFALLSGADGSAEYSEEIAEAALEAKLRPGGANRDYRAGQFAEVYPTKPSIVNYMPKDPLPMFVQFRDINDPKSIEQVDPASINLIRVTIEKTSDDVTTGIEKRLAWLKNQTGSLVKRPANTPIGEMPLAHRVTVSSFRMESSKWL